MRIIRLNLSNVDKISKLHIEVDWQTYKEEIPEFLINASGLEGRRYIWNAALSDNSIWAFGVYADQGREPLGFISGRINSRGYDEKSAHLGGIYVLKQYQYRGFGKALLANFLEIALGAGLKNVCGAVPTKCRSAREFFSAVGFVEHSIYESGSADAPFEMAKIELSSLSVILHHLGS